MNKQQLKFRAWCLLEGEESFIYFDLEDRCSLNFDILDELPIIQQYIGVKDKNGNEIYTGDIVSFQYRDEGLFNGVIGLDDMYLGYSVQDSKAFFGSMQITYHNAKELNVIGNVFKNKELL